MKFFLALMLFQIACLPGDPVKEKAAWASVEKWLTSMDSLNYSTTWYRAAGSFRQTLTPAQWKAAAEAARTPLGVCRTRGEHESEYRRFLPGAPEGEYYLFQIKTDFENGPCVETIVMTLETDDVWRTTGYFIKPR